MDKEQRDGILHLALLPYEMDVQLVEPVNLHSGMVLRELVQLILGLPPVPVLPCFGQPLDIRKRDSQIPLRALEFVRKLGLG